MKKISLFLIFGLSLVFFPSLGLSAPSGDIRPPTSITNLGSFRGIKYLQYDGLFCMSPDANDDCESLVPYRITAPVHQRQGNGVTVVEPPHFAVGLDGLVLGKSFLLERGFSHAGVGFGTLGLNILDPSVPGIHVHGVGPCSLDDPNCAVEYDEGIVAAFGQALRSDPDAQEMIGNNARRRYMIGFSDSSGPPLILVNDGRAEGVFDLVIPFTTGPSPSPDGCNFSPQCSIGEGQYSGKVIVLNSELDDRFISEGDKWWDDGSARNNYRYYAVPGTPHIVDNLDANFVSDHTTPASYVEELRARFLQGHYWVTFGVSPPPSNHLARDGSGEILTDASGNTSTVDTMGRTLPRPPYVQLGEAHFIMGNPDYPPPFLFLLGSVDQVKSAQEISGSYPRYLVAFYWAAIKYALAVRLGPEDMVDLLSRARLCPPLTYTETYLNHYDNFVSMKRCDSP